MRFLEEAAAGAEAGEEFSTFKEQFRVQVCVPVCVYRMSAMLSCHSICHREADDVKYIPLRLLYKLVNQSVTGSHLQVLKKGGQNIIH